MAKLAEQFQYVSGITWFDIYQRPASNAATLSTITADQWSEVGGFREGTFSFTGDEMEITSHKYENGQEIISTTTDGTYGPRKRGRRDLHQPSPDGRAHAERWLWRLR